MSSDPSSWKEYKAPHPTDNRIWEFQRGYKVKEAGRHENSEQFRAFQYYLQFGSGRSLALTAEANDVKESTLATWSKRYNWEKRVASWEKKNMALAFSEANKLQRKQQKQQIMEFRQANEDQARMMMEVSNDIMGIVQKRLAEAEAEGEKIPMGLVSGLIRAAANISDSGRQAWATSLGVNELMQVVESELQDNDDVDEVDIYEIPLDED